MKDRGVGDRVAPGYSIHVAAASVVWSPSGREDTREINHSDGEPVHLDGAAKTSRHLAVAMQAVRRVESTAR
jgi:hypothetical protein